MVTAAEYHQRRLTSTSLDPTSARPPRPARQSGAWRTVMRNDFCLGSCASRESGNRFASTSRLPGISSGAFLASLVFAVALGASGAAHAASCGGSASTGSASTGVKTGVQTATSHASAGGTGVSTGVSSPSSCSTSSRTIMANTAGKVAANGAIETHTSTRHREWTRTNTAVHASNWHGGGHRPKT